MFRARLGVRTRILAIALIPSLTLLVVGVGAAGYLVAEGTKAKEWAVQNQNAIPQTRELMEAVQQERRLTLAQLAGDDTVPPALAAARIRLDGAMRGLIEVSNGLREVDDSKIGDDVAGFNTLLSQMTQVRMATDAGQLPPSDAYMFYNRLLDVISVGTGIAEQTAPDTEIGVAIADGMRFLNAAEAMSRSNALGVMLSTSNGATPIPVEEFLRQVGFYHAEIGNLTTELSADKAQHDRLQALTGSNAWQQLSLMESAVAQRHLTTQAAANSSNGSGSSSSSSSSTSSKQPALPLSNAEWQNAASEVNRGLIDVWTAQNRHSQELAEDKANNSAANSLYAGGGVLVVSIVAFLIALVLANRIIRRLKRLRRQTIAMADERLPETMRRLNDGETIDPAVETPVLDFGHDEIGQVAKAFQHAHAAAIGAAVAEARTREGVKSVFLNIAHRSQIVVHRQLEILDEAEQRQEDPILLDTLFRLDHLATRERRNAENLTILGGGQPGRQWRNPVPLMDLVRSSVGETLDYARVRVARLPEVHVVGTVVADLIHLLAELVDNATAFSPPQSRVEVSGNVVGKGVVTEISDQGMGMSDGELARLNDMLRTPPDFGVAALSADSRLGLFVVAQLAVRHGVTVRLSESDYGGIKAIVLIPSALIVTDSVPPQTPSELTDPGRRRRLPAAPVAESAAAPQPAAGAVATLALESPAPQPPQYAAPQPGGDTRPALPRRSRQANLAAPLAESAPEPPASPAPQARSAEQARDLMSAIENGTRQGRRSAIIPDEQEG
ncbi:sensor histidine kinase [Nocardia brasiliensis]|uniref:histidine kinase n=1 Tax=Nocardia brasiliensis (strain ATCC 700358 / HUJEG-1) TaxID=1133849 RepID=K0F231_NOCB7|nr:nitrate- and nitrite sensing domain-containing protein [Nocardia brasiliensis]AFU03165.1 putative histidine kinase [Nocardia brasiliensis ATCC 700358]OCF86958.1 histidine kinase [Nocardia brasiliensis]